MNNVRQEALEVIKILESYNHKAYIVGGAVRDLLLGKNPSDYDIATSATPEEILNIFSFTKTLDVGMKHGTITVFYKGDFYEITTFRNDGDYIDNRHPISVEFTNDLKDDLKRRDFTINAFAYNGNLVDCFDGIKDLKNKVIRCVGDSSIRFEEDALRIIRALRFSSCLGFSIDDETKKAIHMKKELLKNISIERINQELDKLFMSNCFEIIKEYYDVFEIIFPQISNHQDQILEKAKYFDQDGILFNSLMFIDIFDDDFKKVLEKYHYSKEKNKLIEFLNNVKLNLELSRVSIKKLLKKYGKNDIIYYVIYNCFDVDKKKKFIKLINEVEEECYTLKQLRINGNDLIELGISDGKTIKIILDRLLDLVIEEKLINEHNTLIEYVKKSI